MEKILIFRGGMLAFWIGLSCWGVFYLNTPILIALPIANAFTFFVYLNGKRKSGKVLKKIFLLGWVFVDVFTVVGLSFLCSDSNLQDALISSISGLFIIDFVLSILLTNFYSTQCESEFQRERSSLSSDNLWDSYNPANGAPMISQTHDIHGNLIGTSGTDDLHNSNYSGTGYYN